MPKLIDLTGRRFGRLTVIKRAETTHKAVYWLCQCDCGNKKVVRGSLLTTTDKRKKVRSCTCLLKERAASKQSILTEKATEANKPRYAVEKGTDVKLISSQKLYKNNKSGVTGVRFDNSRGLWQAYLTFKGKTVFCKRFREFDEAVKARKEAESKYFNPVIEKAKSHGII